MSSRCVSAVVTSASECSASNASSELAPSHSPFAHHTRGRAESSLSAPSSYLAILYRRLGQRDKAAKEAATFADQKDDPGATTYALEFLRKHPELANESVTWHTHILQTAPTNPANAMTESPGAHVR
jgi:hypothetical protein